jgi:hypothetical protein
MAALVAATHAVLSPKQWTSSKTSAWIAGTGPGDDGTKLGSIPKAAGLRCGLGERNRAAMPGA